MSLCCRWIVFSLLMGIVCPAVQAGEQSGLRVGTFKVDVTPPLGSPVLIAPVRKVEDPLTARGIVLLGVGKPIVLCAVDWVGASNDGHLFFRESLAQAAGTTVDRVAVHTLHQHDGPRCDFRAEEILEQYGDGGEWFDVPFLRDAIRRTATAVTESIPLSQPVTHLGVGTAIVEKVASNRRILDPTGRRVILERLSRAANDPRMRDAPEGVIDPELKLISFWNGTTPLVSITYYATHPQSYYGNGDVTSDFIGLAREAREKALPQVAHLHFNGAGGNIAAGKYNDGSHQARLDLTERVADAMKRAWESTKKTAISTGEIEWRVEKVNLPVAERLAIDKLHESIRTLKKGELRRVYDALAIGWVERDEGPGVPTELSCLKLGNVWLLQLPGELFVEYQLAAQKMRPSSTVCVAAYGDYAPLYIGTEIAYSQGGFEITAGYTNVSPAVEKVLLQGIQKLLADRPASDSSAD